MKLVVEQFVELAVAAERNSAVYHWRVIRVPVLFI